MQLAVGQDQQQTLAHLLRNPAAGAEEFGGLEIAKGVRVVRCPVLHFIIINTKAARKQSRAALKKRGADGYFIARSNGTISRATMLMTLIIGLMAGPAVSL